MSEPLLPNGFEDPEPFVETWAKSDFAARYQARINSTMPQIKTFYETVMQAMERCATHLEAVAVGEMSPADRRLLYLTYAAMNVSPAVELYQQPDVWLGFEAHRLQLIDHIGTAVP